MLVSHMRLRVVFPLGRLSPQLQRLDRDPQKRLAQDPSLKMKALLSFEVKPAAEEDESPPI